MIRAGDLVRRRPGVALRWTYLSDRYSFPIPRNQVFLVVAVLGSEALLLSSGGTIGWIDCDVMSHVSD